MGEECSVEFCGGNHFANTAEAEAFVLMEETAVAKGARGITVITRGAAKKVVEEGEFVLHACIIVYYIMQTMMTIIFSTNCFMHHP